jgi:hypothetical protein
MASCGISLSVAGKRTPEDIMWAHDATGFSYTRRRGICSRSMIEEYEGDPMDSTSEPIPCRIRPWSPPWFLTTPQDEEDQNDLMAVAQSNPITTDQIDNPTPGHSKIDVRTSIFPPY